MIELKNLTKRYGNTLAVNRLSLTVSKGERIFITNFLRQRHSLDCYND